MTEVAAAGPAGPRSRARVSGAVRRVTTGGQRGAPELRAEIEDGADGVTLVFLGRTRIAGIEPGRMLAAEGTLTFHHGRKIMYNPRYELS